MIHRLFLLAVFLITIGHAELQQKELKKEIGNMLIVGFDQKEINSQTPIVNAIQRYNLGGVILFNRFYDEPQGSKNIESPHQLQQLTSQLKSIAPELFIGIDQEGGKVERLKKVDGFMHTPSAQKMATLVPKKVKEHYETLSKMLRQNGININFAPVVDLAVNPQNKVIYQLERSYGQNAKEVVLYASLFMDALAKEQVFSVLKHFPGHGSSLGDSHQGFVDVTQTWSKKELEPYALLIKQKKVPMIMTAHVFNAQLDAQYPATLSYSTNTTLLRDTLGFEGVIVSDDMQMKAIRNHYGLSQSVRLAINAGVDMLLFGNQLAHDDIEELIETIYKEVQAGKIDYERIVQANQRINALKQQLLVNKE